MKFLSKIFGDPNERVIASMRPVIEEINSLEESIKALSDDDLKQKTEEFRKILGVERLEDGSLKQNKTKEEETAILEQILPQAFAVIREASRRLTGQRHYDVQLMGGMVLHRGQIAEMKTGEGKTLVATLPLYLNALTGRGVQLVTVNDYLSRVGAGWMAPIYHALGLTTGVIVHNTALVYDPNYSDDKQFDDRLKYFRPVPRGEAYNSDILYGTNNEFGFDYLRDNMVQRGSQRVQRELNFAIVDEVDSILIDEARTPLIISSPAEESTDRYYKFAELVSRLQENEDYNKDEKMRVATLTENGISRMEKFLGVDNIYATGGIREVHHIEQALKARVLFEKDKHYVVREGEVVIVDEFTGRLMFGRRYSEGLHQAIEAKEGVKIQRESRTLATVTFQNYFRMYRKLAGMTGTALTEAEEFYKIYNLETVVVPTHRPNVRKDDNDLIYASEKEKYEAVAKEVKARHATGQPVLVGTISIAKNEFLGELLAREGVKTNLLNAKNHEQEASMIAQAGQAGSVTIATNMAGRGVDIILGGAPLNKEEYDKVVALGGLHVIGTERHEARRIDNQLRGRAGRQGDPGSSQFYVSMEDDLMRIFGGDRMKNMMKTLKLPEGTPIENKIISRSIENAQKRVEGNNFDTRKHLVEYDDVINKHRLAIYRRRLEVLNISEKVKDNKEDDIEDNKNVGEKPENNQERNNQEENQNKENIGEVKDKTLTDIILGMIENEVEQLISFHTAAESTKDWNLKEVKESIAAIFPLNKELSETLDGFIANPGKLDKVRVRTDLIELIMTEAQGLYETMAQKAKEAGLDWQEVEKGLLLRAMDTLWMDHLETMDYMRRGIGLRGYGQRDPLVEYKKEAYQLYNQLNDSIQKEVVYSVFKIAAAQEMIAPSINLSRVSMSAPAKTMDNDSSSSSVTVYTDRKAKDDEGNKIGRNDLCPCGSGKKYKKCHGA
ncbi:MAG: preprotein translocase subunit SecA [Patescibacteria group bacterium]|nr:MAG: preprotein translocase subunit SecA [Patescibacteria group bacterium]